jgi:hypothetical protein
MLHRLKQNFIDLTRPLPYPDEDLAPRSPLEALGPNELVHRPDGAPFYYPDPWNDMRRYFNCYSYALRLMGHDMPTPGQLVDRRMDMRLISRASVDTWLERDGLERVLQHSGDYLRDHIIAAFVSPLSLDSESIDYHFYSLDKDGTWSHKLGNTAVTKEDSKGRAIHDPVTAARHYGEFNYNEFVGFYRIPDDGIVYQVKGPMSRYG